MFQNEHQIASAIYNYFFGRIADGVIPIDLRAPALIGTVQDDPFDSLVLQEIANSLSGVEVVGAGKLTTPDIVIRDRESGVVIGLEVKKLIQQPNGADPRGLTLDYNSCLPCGTALIRVGSATVDIPCYYLFCLLDNSSTAIVTLVLMHGDFLNYDFNLHKQAKMSNQSEYGHGPYGEGSVRHRAMYTYPNPLNYKIACFHERKVLVTKKLDGENLGLGPWVTHRISRRDIHDNNFIYSVIDKAKDDPSAPPECVEDIFRACKERKPKKRVSAFMPSLEE